MRQDRRAAKTTPLCPSPHLLFRALCFDPRPGCSLRVDIKKNTRPLRIKRESETAKYVKLLIGSDELDDRHLGVVALPGHGVQDSAVTAVAVAVPLRARLEEGVHELLVVHVSERLQGSKEARGAVEGGGQYDGAVPCSPHNTFERKRMHV